MTMRNKHKRRTLYIILAVICVILFCACLYFIFNPPYILNVNADEQSDLVIFSDVGQGDCAIIYSNGYSAVIDAGVPNIAERICSDLADLRIDEIDVALVSHFHTDHLGSLKQVAEKCSIKNLITPEILNKSIAAATDAKLLITKNGGAYYTAEAGMNFKIGEFEITVLGYLNDRQNENNRSVFTMAEIDGFRFLFTGDAERKAEKYILEQKINVDCDVLKVGHHGSTSSTSQDFLKAATPDYAVISVGKGNMYHHPHSETVNALKKANVKIYRTDKSGDITFDLTNGDIEIETEKQP